MSCVGVPVSWLRLERYALGELAGDGAREIAAHLDACAACRASFAVIEGDARALPPLPAAARAPAPRRRGAWWTRLAWAGGLAAAAAALLLFVVIRRGGDDARLAGPTVRVKGGELVVSLVRERAGVVSADPAGFAPGDRFKVRVTCTPGVADVDVDVVVFQDGEPAWPLAPARLRCGNQVVVPGAFRITGEGPATVCLAISTDRAAVREPRGDGLGCVTLPADR